MTRLEAEKLLGLEPGYEKEDVNDSKDEVLFDLKRFFVSKVPLKKLFDSRLKKMLVISEALEILGVQGGSPFQAIEFEAISDGNILQAFQSYHRQKNAIRTRITASDNVLEIIYLAEKLVELEKIYAQNWFKEDFWDEATLVSKEPDPMEVLRAVEEYAGNGGMRFQQLRDDDCNPPKTLQNEMKRLSLLSKKH